MKELEDCTAATITTRRVLFQPKTERVVVGQESKDGKVKQKYVVVKSLLKDVEFEETHDNTMNVEPEVPDGSDGDDEGEPTAGIKHARSDPSYPPLLK